MIEPLHTALLMPKYFPRHTILSTYLSVEAGQNCTPFVPAARFHTAGGRGPRPGRTVLRHPAGQVARPSSTYSNDRGSTDRTGRGGAPNSRGNCSPPWQGRPPGRDGAPSTALRGGRRPAVRVSG